MSKAFTREDDASDGPALPRPASLLPPGTRNYITTGGAAKLRAELARLSEVERPALLAEAEEPGLRGADAKDGLQRVEQRIAHLQQSLRSAEIVGVPPPPHDVVRFGATVTVRDPQGTKTAYRLVGVDEADPDRNEVSWLSPIARALLNARLGQRVPFRFPAGAVELEIVRIVYDPDPPPVR